MKLTITKSASNRVRNAAKRLANDWSIAEVARRSGVPYPTAYWFCRGDKVSANATLKIAAAINCPLTVTA